MHVGETWDKFVSCDMLDAFLNFYFTQFGLSQRGNYMKPLLLLTKDQEKFPLLEDNPSKMEVEKVCPYF